MSERWLPVVGHEGAYEVSDLGRVRSVDRIVPGSHGSTRRVRGVVLRPAPGRSGHLAVAVHQQTLFVHTLVLTAFRSARPPDLECRHMDGDPTNNAVANLQWDTASENNFDRVRHGTHPSAARDRCPMAHRLIAPNLAAWGQRRGFRICKACSNARSAVHHALVRHGVELDLVVEADARYRQLMVGGAS